MKDLKYLAAYLVPGVSLLSIYLGGFWSFFSFVFLFIAVPILELILPQSTANFGESEEDKRLSTRLFDGLLYLNVPIIFAVLVFYLFTISNPGLFLYERLGMTLSMGILLGYGINVAHELGHRSKPFERFLSKLTLLPNLYMHFIIEHNLGHHKHVSTDKDPASSEKGELIFSFFFKTITGSYRNAWKIERKLLNQKGKSFWSVHNEMIRFTLIQLTYLAVIALVFSPAVMFWAILAGFNGILLLESVNYIEHYGLRRELLASGFYEPVQPIHSWNSNHEMGRILLYELTRHSDHHFKANRKYQVLRHFDESPQMPFGYPTSILIAWFPPLWFAIMNKRVEAIQQRKMALAA